MSWLSIPANSDFSIHNLPYGIFSTSSNPQKRVGVAIGEHILDLVEVANLGFFKSANLNLPTSLFETEFLNDFIALGKPQTAQVRTILQTLLQATDSPLASHAGKVLVAQAEATMHLPVRIGDYTDFYSSIEHATNVGIMFRDPANALLPNWKHLPVGYHGRASSIVVSGTDITRPHGQTKADSDALPTYQPSKQLDFELEVAFIMGKETALGEPIRTEEAENHIFGLVLFNDWSARDLQKWEYVPLGPFLGKNFGSTISAWVVPLEALEPFRVATPTQEPPVLPYLRFEGLKNYDLNLEVAIKPEGADETVVSKSNFKYMYWNMVQQLAHHTVNGCNVRVGDMCASGTISGHTPNSYGSMLELAWKGTKPLQLNNGTMRTFIQDHDTVIVRGFCEKEGIRVGFGEARGKILPARTEL
jgi:fumarylacetoacetase